jgi:Protein of unknown function (DUF3667)/Domain of unknown function (DUF4286)
VAALAQGNTLPVAATAATAGGVAYEAELEIAPTRLHDVEAWLPGHVAEILQLPGFQSVESFKLGETADGWFRRKNIYRVASRADLEHYLEHVAPQMSARLKASFGDSVRATRRMLVPAPLSQSLPATLAATATGVSCMNCGGQLVGEHCHHCGQRHQPHLHSLWHFLREATENLTHADSRLWRTLWALVAKPGVLTREFIDGRRARYLPPFRLYLVISVAFFVTLGAVPMRGEMLTFDPSPPAARASKATTKPADPAQFCDGLSYGGPGKASVEPRLRVGCRKTVLDNGTALKSEFMQQMPRAMFVLLPLLALFMLLLYWRPRRYYVEHLLFFVHAHAALFSIMIVRVAIGAIPGASVATGFLDIALLLYVPWYLYKAMRRTYAQPRVLTVCKFALLGFFYVALASVVAGFTLIYSVAAL